MDENRFMPPGSPDPHSDLTRSILARTSGSPCARLRELACDFADGVLDAERRALAQSHLDHCPGCTALVAALGASASLLPRLAEADPGPWFAQRVLNATSRAPRSVPARRWWERLMRRPRIALEAAYLGAMAGMVGFNLPSASLSRDWHAPALVRPIGASAKNLLQAEQRTARAVAGIFVAPEGRLRRVLGSWKRDLFSTEPSGAPPRPSPQTHE